MTKEYIAYVGEIFSVEWYYDARGKSQAYEYYQSLSELEKIDTLRLLKMIGTIGKIRNTTKFNYEGDQIYAFKPQAERFLCFFFSGKKLIITNAFRKKQQKLPKAEKDKALKYKNDYINRIKDESYYENKNIINFRQRDERP